MSEKIEAVLKQLEEVNEDFDEKVKNMDVNESMSNLYMILLQYYDQLKKIDHPKIELITDCMDALIMTKNANLSKSRLIKAFDMIHSKAYHNINEIYDYDQQNKAKDITDTETESDIEREEKSV